MVIVLSLMDIILLFSRAAKFCRSLFFHFWPSKFLYLNSSRAITCVCLISFKFCQPVIIDLVSFHAFRFCLKERRSKNYSNQVFQRRKTSPIDCNPSVSIEISISNKSVYIMNHHRTTKNIKLSKTIP